MSDAREELVDSEEIEFEVAGSEAGTLPVGDKRQQMNGFNFRFTPAKPPVIRSRVIRVLSRIPVMSKMIASLDGTSGALSRFVNSIGKATQASQTAGHAMQYAAVGIDAVNFLIIPIIYALAWYYDEDMPFQLTDGAKWFYSALILALAAAALASSGAAAAGLMATFVCLGLAASITIFSILVINVKNHKQAIREFDVAIQEKKAELAEIIAQSKNEDVLDAEVDELYQRYQDTKAVIQALVDQRALEYSQLKEKNGLHMLDTGVGIGFAAIVAIGFVLTFPAFGPVMASAGFVVMAGGGALAFTYLSARLLSTWIPKGLTALKNWWNKSPKEDTDSQTLVSSDARLHDQLAPLGPNDHEPKFDLEDTEESELSSSPESNLEESPFVATSVDLAVQNLLHMPVPPSPVHDEQHSSTSSLAPEDDEEDREGDGNHPHVH